MRRELVIFVVILVVIFSVGMFGSSLLMKIAVGQLKSAFPGYDVSVGSVEFRSAGLIAVSGVDIKKDELLHYKVRSLEIAFSPVSIFTRSIPKVAVKDGIIAITDKSKKLKDLIEYPTAKPGKVPPQRGKGFVPRSISVSNLILTLNTADWKLNAVVNGDIKVDKTVTYNAKVKAEEIDLALLPKGLDAEGRVEMKGKMAGTITLRGEAAGGAKAKIADIKGEFETAAPGGSLVITDKGLLKKLAENTKQPLSIIEDSFEHYDFTKGTLGVSRDADSILLRLVLDGAKGKRDITIALHGF